MIADRIHLEHVRPPVPSTAFDWRATFDSYSGEPGDPMGYGPTPYDAVLALLREADMLDDDYDLWTRTWP